MTQLQLVSRMLRFPNFTQIPPPQLLYFSSLRLYPIITVFFSACPMYYYFLKRYSLPFFSLPTFILYSSVLLLENYFHMLQLVLCLFTNGHATVNLVSFWSNCGLSIYWQLDRSLPENQAIGAETWPRQGFNQAAAMNSFFWFYQTFHRIIKNNVKLLNRCLSLDYSL